MGFLTSLFGGDNSLITVLFALGVVLLLVVLAVWALKLIFTASGRVARGRNKRLAVVDFAAIDQRRQLVLVRRDDVEHLLLIGGAQELVVETNIAAAPAAARPHKRQAQAASRGRGEPTAAPAEAESPASATPGTDRTREFLHQPAARKSPSLRHTGLLRPVARTEPSLIPMSSQNSETPIADSDMNEAAPLPVEGSARGHVEEEGSGEGEVRLGGGKQ